MNEIFPEENEEENNDFLDFEDDSDEELENR